MVMLPSLMPKLRCSTRATGARQLVVHEALDTMWCFSGSYWSWFTPMTMVMSSSLAGAVMMTFLAPLSMCTDAWEALRKIPVLSTTTSTSYWPQAS